MKHPNPMRDAIDESLSGVRFNAQDMRSVLRAVRREPAKSARNAHKRHRRLEPVFAAVMLVLIVAPFSLFALRTGRTQPVTSIGDPILTPNAVQTFTPPTAAISPSASPKAQETAVPGMISREDAIRIARECYEAHCDTSIFAFEEFTVHAALSQPAEGCAQYTVRMESIYDNGCSFTVVVSAADGKIIQYSSPSLATQAAANSAK